MVENLNNILTLLNNSLNKLIELTNLLGLDINHKLIKAELIIGTEQVNLKHFLIETIITKGATEALLLN